MGIKIQMSEVENKFILMSRIAVSLSRVGIASRVSIAASGEWCDIVVFSDQCTVETAKSSLSMTEQDLIDWWSTIENHVE